MSSRCGSPPGSWICTLWTVAIPLAAIRPNGDATIDTNPEDRGSKVLFLFAAQAAAKQNGERWAGSRRMALDQELIAAALPLYDLHGELGRGAWGVCIAARHRQLGRDVAIKQLPRSFGADPAGRARFVAGARLLGSLDHTPIVPIYDFAE